MSATKTDFIKFNVSPEFKALARKKANENGMTISELGRMLFGAFVTGISKPKLEISPEFIALAQKAKKDHKAGKGELISNQKELEKYLSNF